MANETEVISCDTSQVLWSLVSYPDPPPTLGGGYGYKTMWSLDILGLEHYMELFSIAVPFFMALCLKRLAQCPHSYWTSCQCYAVFSVLYNDQCLSNCSTHIFIVMVILIAVLSHFHSNTCLTRTSTWYSRWTAAHSTPCSPGNRLIWRRKCICSRLEHKLVILSLTSCLSALCEGWSHLAGSSTILYTIPLHGLLHSCTSFHCKLSYYKFLNFYALMISNNLRKLWVHEV